MDSVSAIDRRWFGHPRTLARLFATEMWERLGYYGMRALLTLYLTKHFLLDDHAATGLYGGFTALVFLTPLAGGLAADRVLGAKRSVRMGALLMAAGYFAMAFVGPPAKAWIAWDGVRHEITEAGGHDGPTSADEARRTVLVDGRSLVLSDRRDGDLELRDRDGKAVRVLSARGLARGSSPDRARLWLLLVALSMIAVGNGLFKPNISTMVGALYEAVDRRRDAGFTIFYMGINLGSMFGQFLCPWLADAFGWGAAFALAGSGMLAAWSVLTASSSVLAGLGEPPAGLSRKEAVKVLAIALAAVPAFALALAQLVEAPSPEGRTGVFGYLLGLPVMGKVLFGTFMIGVPMILVWVWINGSRREFRMMLAAMVLVAFNCVFWALFEQAGSSLTLFADRNTDRSVFGLFTLSAPQTQNFNSLSIVLLAPIVSTAWGWLARRGWEPSVPVKFALALMGAGAGFLLLVYGSRFAGQDARMGLGWLAGLYAIHSLAELFISPVGLSMITGLAMARITGLMMGVWFLSLAMGQYLAGMVAQGASVAAAGDTPNAQRALATYVDVFGKIGWTAIALGALLLFLSRPLTRLTRGEQAFSR